MEWFSYLVDFVMHFDKQLPVMIAQYGHWIYAILFLIVFCETGLVIFPFLPGDSLLFVTGVLATEGSLDIRVLIAVLIIAAILGDNTNYWIGRKFGARVWTWKNSRFFNRAAFEKTHAFFETHGGKTIILARFLPVLRTFAPFVAGVAEMTYRRFVLLDVIGAFTWIGSLCLAGFYFGKIPVVKDNLGIAILVVVGISVLPVVVGVLSARRQARKNQ